jgi:hypothetical protein
MDAASRNRNARPLTFTQPTAAGFLPFPPPIITFTKFLRPGVLSFFIYLSHAKPRRGDVSDLNISLQQAQRSALSHAKPRRGDVSGPEPLAPPPLASMYNLQAIISLFLIFSYASRHKIFL